jgi:hypothetical protein
MPDLSVVMYITIAIVVRTLMMDVNVLAVLAVMHVSNVPMRIGIIRRSND